MNFQVILLIDHSIAVANIFVNIHNAPAPSLNVSGIVDAFSKQCTVQYLCLRFFWLLVLEIVYVKCKSNSGIKQQTTPHMRKYQTFLMTPSLHALE